MQVALVIGDVVATRKDAALSGLALLVVQPLDPAGAPVGRALVAADAAGAGVGERVFFVRGKEAAFPFHPLEPRVDSAFVGIVDLWSAEGAPAPACRA
jgi:ethanolamine utilization protein EutN